MLWTRLRTDKPDLSQIPLKRLFVTSSLAQRIVSSLSGRKRMKFSHQLLFNSQPEWASHYIAYEQLKSAIYKFERDHVNDIQYEPFVDDSIDRDLESGPLLQERDRPAADKLFIRLLDKELSNITEFYAEKEKELLSELQLTLQDADRIENEGVFVDDSDYGDDEDYDDDDDDSIDDRRKMGRDASTMSKATPAKRRRRALSSASRASQTSATKDANLIPTDDDGHIASIPEEATSPLRARTTTTRSRRKSLAEPSHTASVWSNNSGWARDARITFKMRLQAHYREIAQLKSFVQLNHTGFRKALKKFDKIMDSNLQKQYMPTVVDAAFPFQTTTRERLDNALQSVIPAYANIATRGDEEAALRQLRVLLREHVVYERNTVWRDLMGLERKGWGRRGPGLGKPVVQTADDDDKQPKVVTTPVGRLRIPHWLGKELVGGAFGLVLFVALLNSEWLDRPEENNCLALLAFAVFFWAFEVIPLFVTALLVPFLAITLRVFRSTDGEDRRLTAPEATKFIFSQMFNATIMLLLGGFTLAAALSKHNIDKVLASRVLSLAGTSPKRVLGAYMIVACFASMWISNVAAPVLCIGLIEPILRTLPPHSSFPKALLLGIALASNIGGQSSPISSPQNLIAIEYTDPPLTWLQWFAVALPVSAASIFLIWLLLLWSYGYEKGLSINPTKPSKEKFNATQWYICGVALGTIGLWCAAHSLSEYFGDMGVIALIPLVLFYGAGVLRKQDFENYPWAIVFLAMGGIALGRAVLSSGLLADMDDLIERAVRGLDIWPILAVFSALCLVIATCISHTIASVLIVPIAAQIGNALEEPHPRLLIMATALICSAGMGLPVSGFPNMTAINVEDELGVRYLEASDFLRNGIPASFLATAVILTLGYVMMRLIGL